MTFCYFNCFLVILEFYMNRLKIIKNCIKCNSCGDVIESFSRHDFKYCSCHRVAVDGGLDYLRRCFTDSSDDYEELSITENDSKNDDNSA